jgi:hypothetical protein
MSVSWKSSRTFRCLTLTVPLAVCMSALLMPGAAAAKWSAEGKEFTEGQSATFVLEATEPLTFTSKVLGSEFQMRAENVSCSGTCTIDQKGAVDHSSEAFAMSNIVVTKPPGCLVIGPIATVALTNQLVMDPSGGTATFVKMFPESGTTIAEVVITGCAAAGTYPVKGTLVCRANNTGVSAIQQPLVCSPAEEATGGGSLKLGANTADVLTVWSLRLGGALLGRPWAGS